MNALVFFLAVCLALASGKSFLPVVYHHYVANPYATPFVATPHATPFAAPPHAAPFVATPYAAPFVVNPQQHHVLPVIGVPDNSVYHNRYHAQGDDGSYSFGYSGGPSSRSEMRDKFGNVQGAFNYVDPYGAVQTQQYVADGHGFRVAATNLPRAPVVDLHQPKPVEETPEVKAARAKFEEAFQKAVKSRVKRDADPAFFTATSYKSPASTVPIAPAVNSFVPFPFQTYTAGHTFPTNAYPSVYTAASPSFPTNVYPSVYTAASPSFPTNVHPSVYRVAVPSPTPFAYSGLPVTPIVFGSHPGFNTKEGKFTQTIHNPGVAVSYRVDV